MIDILINDIEQAMLNTLSNEQLCQLRKVLEYAFRNVSVTEIKSENTEESNSVLISAFLSSKSVEGCSEKTIAYYRSTLNNALLKVGKKISHVTTDDLRTYLNNYHKGSGASKVTVDNIRRILSSFFAYGCVQIFSVSSKGRLMVVKGLSLRSSRVPYYRKIFGFF